MAENELRLWDHLLVCIDVDVNEECLSEYLYLKKNFCGQVLYTHGKDLGSLDLATQTPHGTVYVCGDIQALRTKRKDIPDSVKVIKELSYNTEGRDALDFVALGEVPINLHNVAVYYRDSLNPNHNHRDYFDILQSKHQFQALTESNKSGTSFRKGAYLSEVETADGDTLKFNLLRCSTNLDGPTLAFVDEDREILSMVNKLAQCNFEQKTDLNHVLAQLYENTITVHDANKIKEHKAKIKSHSDKTKDMPANGLIAFCTFYSSGINLYKAPSHDRFNRYYKDASVLTQLRFRLKSEVHHLPLSHDFQVPLYPNSVLLISLSTNRLYTHEIVPPTLPVGRFPTRLGYIVRCSKTKAVSREGATFIQDHRLQKATVADRNALKELYYRENTTAEMIEYKDIYFSLNAGDYRRPVVE